MDKNKAIIAAAITIFMTYGIANAVPSGPFGYDLQKDMHRDEQPKEETKKEETQTNTASVPVKPTNAKDFYSFVPIKEIYTTPIDTSVYYSNPTINNSIAKYKKGNYTGCLQELYSYIKKHPADAYAYYYMGMAYTKIGENQLATKCYQKAINCNAKGKLLEQSLKGRDCITGGTYCHAFDINPTIQGADSLDTFINAPYSGNGFSPELQQQYKQQQLNNLQKQINRKNNLDQGDIDEIQKIENKSETFIGEKLAMAASVDSEPSNSEVLEAIDVLKRAGLNITASPAEAVESSTRSSSAATSTAADTSEYQASQELQQLNMMLGGNNNNNDLMTNMIPMMMNANNNGQKIDPQVIQSLMTNSMLNSLNNMNTNDNK